MQLNILALFIQPQLFALVLQLGVSLALLVSFSKVILLEVFLFLLVQSFFQG